MREHLARTLLVACLVVGAAFPAVSNAAPADRGSPARGFVRLLAVHDRAGREEGAFLHAVDWLPDRKIERWLVAAPGGGHLVLSETRLSREGWTEIRLSHEESGWFAVWTERSGSKLAVDQLGNPLAVVDEYARGEWPRSVSLEASGLEEAFEYTSTTWDESFEEEFFWLFESQPAADRFAREVDPRTISALRFLGSVAACERCAFSAGRASTLIDLVMKSLGDHGRLEASGDESKEWTVEPAAVVRSAKDDPQVMKLLSEFGSVPSPDPLADLRSRAPKM